MLPPRYKLNAGRRLTYRMSGDAVSKSAAAPGDRSGSRYCVEWDCYVIARNDDSHRIIFSQSHASETISQTGEPRHSTFACDGYFDLTELGDFIANESITPMANPTVLFPALPVDDHQLSTGWRTSLALDDMERAFYHMADLDSNHRNLPHFREDCRTSLDGVYCLIRDRDYAFDTTRGMVTTVQSTVRRGWPEATSDPIIDTIELIDDEFVETNDKNGLTTDAAQYFAACAQYRRLTDRALWDLPHANDWLAQATTLLTSFNDASRAAPIADWGRRQLKLHQDEVAELSSGCKQLRRWLGGPSPDWNAFDLEGRPQRLADYRGRPLVICFWNRGCTWAIRTLIALNRLAQSGEAPNAAFLAVCVDPDQESAAHVWQVLNMSFPTIAPAGGASALASSFEIYSCPMTLVIDGSGAVRRIREGFTLDLPRAIVAEITTLAGR